MTSFIETHKRSISIIIFTVLIVIATTARSDNGIDSAVVWWTSFLPVVCGMWNIATYKPVTNLFLIFCASVAHYLAFHSYFYFIPPSDFDFSRLSVASFTIITTLIYFEMTRDARATTSR